MENNSLVAFRRDIRILDAIIRDGGIVNNFALECIGGEVLWNLY